MTALSPRLAHLLIQEDRTTGRLILPEGMAPKDAPGLSPPLSPMPFAFSALPPIEPLHKPLPGVGSLLPPPRTGSSRVASHSLMSILNNDIDSPPSSASSSIGPSRYYQTRRSPSPVSPMSYPSSVPYHLQPRGSHDLGPGPSRPVLPRRHSDHPSEPAPFRPRPSDPYTPISGSRAPISRTTKACNACRARKVRCDAGGGGEPSTCSRCKEGGISCVYAGAQKKRGPCPGSVRPSSRSVKSVTNTYVKTPEEEEDTHGRRRSSYGFPNYDRPVTPRSAGHPYSFAHEQYRASSPWQSRKPSIAQTPVLSWPAMRPATDEDDLPLKYFGDNYSMGPMDRQESRGIRVEVHRRDSYYQRP